MQVYNAGRRDRLGTLGAPGATGTPDRLKTKTDPGTLGTSIPRPRSGSPIPATKGTPTAFGSVRWQPEFMRPSCFRFSPCGMLASNSQAAEAGGRPATRPGGAGQKSNLKLKRAFRLLFFCCVVVSIEIQSRHEHFSFSTRRPTRTNPPANPGHRPPPARILEPPILQKAPLPLQGPAGPLLCSAGLRSGSEVFRARFGTAGPAIGASGGQLQAFRPIGRGVCDRDRPDHPLGGGATGRKKNSGRKSDKSDSAKPTPSSD